MFSTRPFLTPVEKKWITYQLLSAVERLHFYGQCHGDIKLENFLLTSWNWVYLSDFACCKPTYIPEVNLATFRIAIRTTIKFTLFRIILSIFRISLIQAVDVFVTLLLNDSLLRARNQTNNKILTP
jgi:serine/threonine protein kinase